VLFVQGKIHCEGSTTKSLARAQIKAANLSTSAKMARGHVEQDLVGLMELYAEESVLERFHLTKDRSPIEFPSLKLG
jgi:hypothetical protein